MARGITFTITVISLVPALLYLLYRRLFPQPRPGIPYNHAATKSLLGDAQTFMKASRPDVHNWIVEQCVMLDSPVIQLFMRPFRRPWVVLVDFQEANDILTRRTREFDRSDFFGDLFISMLPEFQAHMSTGEQWKAHRKLTGDLMASSFLNDTISQRIYEGTHDLISLWKQKSRLAGERAFSAKQDVSCATLDAIWTSTFGNSIGVTTAQRVALEAVKNLTVDEDEAVPVEFPTTNLPSAFHSIIQLTQSIEICTKSPFPRPHHRLALALDPTLRSARKHKDRLIQDQLDKAWEKFSRSTTDTKASSAIDLLVQREVALAKKEQRSSGQNVAAIRDELFGFLLAAHDTTATTICWGIKFLTLNVSVQKHLREALMSQLQLAFKEQRSPTAREIATADIPYLDAVIEETHRCGRTAPAIIRRATCDTEILGYKVPKGTDVFMECHGPSFESPPMRMEEEQRSQTSLRNKDRLPWSVDDIGQFRPQRWLFSDSSTGEATFDPKAGPALPFGAGPRACFGRKLASLQLKIMLALMVWNFKLLPTPPALSSLAQHDVLTGEPEQCFVCLEEVKS